VCTIASNWGVVEVDSKTKRHGFVQESLFQCWEGKKKIEEGLLKRETQS